MKSQLLYALLLFCLISSTGIAQPILTASGINPVVGDKFVIAHSSHYVNPGNAGINQTWDISLIDADYGTYPYSVNNASLAPYDTSFSSAANIAIDSGQFYEASLIAFRYYGFTMSLDTNIVIAPYSDPADILHFPFTYGNSFYDTYRNIAVGGLGGCVADICGFGWVTGADSNCQYSKTGTRTVTADGYGTLKTPAGTFNNVLRIHYVDNGQDSLLCDQYYDSYQIEGYAWFENGFHLPLAWTDTTIGGVPDHDTYYLDNVTGLDEQSNLSNFFSLYPNPASDYIYIHGSLNKMNTVTITNLLGANIQTVESESDNDLTLNVRSLSSGIYFVEITSEKERWVGKFVKE